jgi:ectoine hydroxylase-related dioxygenase (phytanoyl-CoA dioxygenase family)
MINDFKINGWVHIKNIIPDEFLKKTKEIVMDLKTKSLQGIESNTQKEYGSFGYWKGMDMASKVAPELYEMYTSKFMYDIAKELLETEEVYLYNDQVVVKLPNEDFEFPIHTDNDLGPNPNYARTGVFKTITCCWVLDDFTLDNAPISILNTKTKQWETPLPKEGDIIIWNGNTYHKSGINKTNSPRRVYLMVYSNKDVPMLSAEHLKKDFVNRYYNIKFPI